MIHGSMRHYENGRKKKYNAWTNTKRETPFTEYKLSYSQPVRRGASQASQIKSVVVGGQVFTSKVEPQKYTGTLVKGISTMHKSNAVPILSKEEAKDHASMRR